VLKFGGTSVAALARWQAIASVLAARRAEGFRPLVVCSALGGVSNLLEELIGASLRHQQDDTLSEIRTRHADLAEAMELELDREIGADLAALQRLALGLSLVEEASPRVRARVMALGELMSSRLGAAFLRKAGHDVHWLDVRDVLIAERAPNVPDELRLLSASCDYERDPEWIERLDALGGDGVITQGFIARDERGETVLLGRGGSDTSASYLAAKLGAARCEIWTDVPGMYTAQPQQIPSARLIKSLDYAEAQEIVSTGAKVLHPRSIAPVRDASIPLHIRCTPRPEIDGTIIQAKGREDGAEVKAISVKRDVMLVSMATPGMWQQVGFLADVFAEFKRAGLSIDLVSTSEMNVTVTLDAASTLVARDQLDELVEALRPHCRARVIGPCATISLVGQHIRAILHELAPALEVFEEQRVHLVSQAASDLNLSFVVDLDQVDRLVAQLHDLLFARRSADPALGPSWQETFGEQPSEAAMRRTGKPPWWVRRRSELMAEADRETPVYVYDPAELDRAASELGRVESVSRVLYAMKANPNREILRRFERAGLGFETVSPGELALLFELFPELDPERVLFTPNFAPRAEYERAFGLGVHVTVDSLFCLEQWPELFRDRELFVRIDPGRRRGHHEHVRTAGATSKFGVSPEQIGPVAERIAAVGALVKGLHAHLGSGIRTAED
jgi:diaminopimelate decarboxylase/aspartate kinase